VTVDKIILAFILFATVATLYSAVGHAGASGYLALMALLSFAPETIKPTSLVLNIVVASIASVKYIRADCFDKKIFLSFIVASVPMAFLGGYIPISPKYFKLIAGIFLIVASFFLLIRTYYEPVQTTTKPMPLAYGLIGGSFIGLISGLVGVGGGIFLSPIIILANWTSVKNASGVAALFILCNSVSGLAGHLVALNKLEFSIIYWIVAVIIGGLFGSYLGTIKFNNKIIIACLFLVLLTAGLKFLLVDFAK
jgi:uncharacterized membrane protein YfcA